MSDVYLKHDNINNKNSLSYNSLNQHTSCTVQLSPSTTSLFFCLRHWSRHQEVSCSLMMMRSMKNLYIDMKAVKKGFILLNAFIQSVYYDWEIRKIIWRLYLEWWESSVPVNTVHCFFCLQLPLLLMKNKDHAIKFSRTSYLTLRCFMLSNLALSNVAKINEPW